jgi:hypothetical protein
MREEEPNEPILVRGLLFRGLHYYLFEILFSERKFQVTQVLALPL